ncbi:hypothetical protein R2R35_19240 [Anaerocolumna sp. AGMB13020]|uniref:hypothetical protein n=1 Tax=Anaerocolumna sp. AGMB13020 TaxID=3081750 RepID=UPI0029538ECA|nr:hypothetical protein [Anaerocolumna sp. AGMB13020]WOO35909.1 hypothetical protein R2R35_19240 [Anaerocolumna sp. AGMB13020]
MKDIHREYNNSHKMKKIRKFIFSGVMVFALVLAVPGNYLVAYAAPLEDCDLDGFDDATGVPVPWPGYDETKGDTPDGPGGSKNPTTSPGSTNSSSGNTGTGETTGNTGSGASGNTGSTDTDKTDSVKSEDTKTSSSKDTDSGKTGSKSSNTATDSTDKTSSQPVGAAKNSSKSGTDKAASTTTAGTSKSSVTSGNSVSGSSGTGNTSSGSSASSTDKLINAKIETDNTSKATGNESNKGAESTASIDTEDEGAGDIDSSKSEAETESSQSETDIPVTEQQSVVTVNEITEASDTSEDVISTAVNAKGSLVIKEVSGSILHAGSSVIISGTGFAGNVQKLEMVIQSELRQLGFVESSAEGTFEAQLVIPKDLSAGVHQIVVLYEGNEITRQEIEIGPKAADSFLQALSAGFTTENHGLVPGLLILSGLIVAGAGVLGYSILFHSDKRKVIPNLPDKSQK